MNKYSVPQVLHTFRPFGAALEYPQSVILLITAVIRRHLRSERISAVCPSIAAGRSQSKGASEVFESAPYAFVVPIPELCERLVEPACILD